MISNLKIRIKELEEQLQEREVKYQLTHVGFCTMFPDLFVFSPFFLLQCGWDFFKLCKELTLPRFFPTFGKDQLGKILRHHWKRRLYISKLAKFESDRSKASEDIALQSCKNLQTIVLGGGQVCNPRPYKCL